MAKSTQVAHITETIGRAGLEQLVLTMHTYTDHNPSSMIITLNNFSPEYKNAMFDIHSIKTNRRHYLKIIVKLIQLFKKHQISIIHTHSLGPLLYAGLAARLCGITKHIHTLHDAWHLDDKKDRVLHKSAVFFSKPILTAISENTAKHYQTHFPQHSVNIIKNGIDINKFTPLLKNKKTTIQPLYTIGCVGRLESVKGHEYLIDAMKALPNNIHLKIAGTGSLEKALQDKIKKNNLTDQVTFIGEVTDTPAFYQSIDLFCLPSLNEGLPLTLLEAQACGVHSICTDVGGCSEGLCPKTGILIPSKNPKAISGAVLQNIGQAKAHSPRDYIVNYFNLETMMKKYKQLYNL